VAKTYEISVLPGDGAGREVIAQAVRVLETLHSKQRGVNLKLHQFECGGEYYLEHEREWSEKAEDFTTTKADAILLGAVGAKHEGQLVRLPDGNMAGYNIVIGLRQRLDLYANVRPVRLYEGVPTPLADKGPRDIDMVIVRENTEGLYIPARQRVERSEGQDFAIDMRVISTRGSERVSRFAFELATGRTGAPSDGTKRVTCVDKSNLLEGCRLFRETFNSVGNNYPRIEKDYAFVDAWTLLAIMSPEHYDVVVAPNAFGDIISDMGGALQGGLGMAPSGNIGDSKALFEPVHGSAPDIAGKGRANPIAAILSVVMMLDWLGDRHRNHALKKAATTIETAVEGTLQEGSVRTQDLCRGEWASVTPSSTEDVTSDIIEKME